MPDETLPEFLYMRANTIGNTETMKCFFAKDLSKSPITRPEPQVDVMTISLASPV